MLGSFPRSKQPGDLLASLVFSMWREYRRGCLDGIMGTEGGHTLVLLLHDRVPCLTGAVAIATIVLRPIVIALFLLWRTWSLSSSVFFLFRVSPSIIIFFPWLLLPISFFTDRLPLYSEKRCVWGVWLPSAVGHQTLQLVNSTHFLLKAYNFIFLYVGSLYLHNVKHKKDCKIQW